MSRQRRSRTVRLVRGALWALAVGHVLEAAVARHRRRQLIALDVEEPMTAESSRPVEVMTAGDDLDPAIRARAAALMASTDLEVVDLVPGDLSPDRLLRVLRRLDFQRLADDVIYAPGGVHEALVLTEDAAKLAPEGAGAGMDRGRLVRATVEAQRFAPTTKALRLAADLRTAPWTPEGRWRELQELLGYMRPLMDVPPLVIALETLHLLALSAGLVVAPVPAAAALATWSAQPALALGGQDDPGTIGRAVITRLVDRWIENLRTWAAYPAARAPGAVDVPEPPPAEVLFEARVDTCPWCGSAAIVDRVDTWDLNQFKPGVFHLDACTGCGHIFQNPRLSLTGLAHYYADVYDGVGEEMLEYGLSTRGKRVLYDGRVDAVAAVTEPTRWLDVGTGHGHFCLVARQRWPEVHFDGLDQSESVLKAHHRRRIDGAHIGQFPDLADQLAGSYDVVSMNHYLEHSVEPRREIAAAAAALVPGGHLLIEMPDAASPWTRFGPYWVCWLQPQHLHFIPCENLIAELESAGFEIESVERAGAGEGYDALMATALFAQHHAGHGRLVPWLPPPSPWHRLRRALVFTASAPLFLAATVTDLFKDPWQSRPGSTTPGNAYRVVARRR